MALAAGLDWLFVVLGWALGVSGVALGVWALFCDRARGCRRCPKCWYDMAGVPGLTCPECGRAAKSERRLAKTRRKRWWAALGAGVVALGVTTYHLPGTLRSGWIGMVPSPVLIWVAPLESIGAGVGGAAGTGPGIGASGASGQTLAERLDDEVWARLVGCRLARWQSQLVIERCLRRGRPEGAWTIRTPARWPAGRQPLVQMPVGLAFIRGPLFIEFWSGPTPGSGHFTRRHPSTDEVVSLEQSARAGDDDRLHVRVWSGDTVLYHGRRPLGIDFAPSVAALLTPVASAEAAAVVREIWSAVLDEKHDRLWLTVDPGRSMAAADRLDFIAACQVELRTDGEPIARGAVPIGPPYEPGRSDRRVMLEWVRGGRARLAAAGDRLEVRLRGSAELAVARYLGAPFDVPGPRCWTGEVVVPIPPVGTASEPYRTEVQEWVGGR